MSKTQYKNRSVHFTISGRGSTLVFLHGFLEDLSMWDKLESQLAQSHKVIRIDLLGHGATEVLGDVHSMEDQAEMVNAVLKELKIDRYAIIGHSMGGYIALALAELYPQDISGLCLMNSTSLADSEEKKQNRDRAVEAVKNNHKSFVRIAIPGLFAPENRNRFKESVMQAVQVGLQMTPDGIAAALKGMKIRKDRSLVFKNGNYPKLLVIGKKDPALDFDSLLPQSNYPGVETAVFEDGHMSHIENREELEKHLTHFLKRASSA